MATDFDAPVLPIELIETGNLPTVIASSGLQPTPPAVLRSQLVEIVLKTNPGFTANLPGTLIEDIVSTDVQAMVMIDQARVEALNSLTPYGCNEFVLILLGKIYGVPIGQPTNTSVFVVFTGLPGFVIGKGFIVSDGAYNYIVQDGGVIGAASPPSTLGQSPPLFCVSPTAGGWAVPAGTVTALITPPPTGYTLSAINPSPGVPATEAENATQYRARVLRAGLAASQGMARYLRTLLSNVRNVQARLIGVKQQPGGGWLIMCGGGDPYVTAYAIYQALFDISTLVGSQIKAMSITAANPAVVTTDLNHGYLAGSDVTLAGGTPAGYNGAFVAIPPITQKTFALGKRYTTKPITVATWAAGVATYTTGTAHGVTTGSLVSIVNFAPVSWNVDNVVATVTSPTTFTVPKAADPGVHTTMGQLAPGVANFDSTGLGAYVSGAIATPNSRNREVTIIDYPDSYIVRYVDPPPQTLVGTVVTWNTNSPNFVSPAAISQLAGPALTQYVNSINVGEPINLLQMSDVFQNAVVSVLPPSYLSRLLISVAINGVVTPADPGTHVVKGDPESYFFATPVDFTIVQG